ncbi:MAG TPA: hypothetical protein VH744_11820 [Terriglobales bacterium]|jgi:hypothetical protein
MKRFDRVCAGAIFLLAIAHCLTAGSATHARLWYFSGGLAVLFAAMLNLLRIRNGYAVKGLRMFCIAANVMLTVFVVSLIASIGWPRTLQNPAILVALGLLIVETGFSLGKNQK